MGFRERVIRENELLWNMDNQGKPIVFWGIGNSMKAVKEALEKKGIVPTAFCDNNMDIVGTYIENIPVFSYEQIRERYTDYILILTVAINNAIPIMKQLREQKEEHPVYHIEHSFKVEDGFLEYSYLEEHKDEFEVIYQALKDEKSQDIFVQNINFKLSGNKIPLLDYVDGDSFFDKTLMPVSEHYSYMDVGAYTGDTLLRFYAFCGGMYDKLYAVEPDSGNYDALNKVVKYGRLGNVKTFHVGGWNVKGELTFYTVTNKNAINFDSPNFFKDMQHTAPNSWEIDKSDYGKETMQVDTVDNLLQGAKCDVIKINALAADYQVLMGCRETIKEYKPILVGEFGTQKEYVTALLSEIIKMNPNYKIYIRQKMIFGDCKTVYYAIDSNR